MKDYITLGDVLAATIGHDEEAQKKIEEWKHGPKVSASEAYKAGWEDACKAIAERIYDMTLDCHCDWVAEQLEDECPSFEEN